MKTATERKEHYATDTDIDHYAKNAGGMYAWKLETAILYVDGFEHTKKSGPTMRNLTIDNVWRNALEKARERCNHANSEASALKQDNESNDQSQTKRMRMNRLPVWNKESERET